MLLALQSIALAASPIDEEPSFQCEGPMDVRSQTVPMTSYAGGVAYTSYATTYSVLDGDKNAVDTLTLAYRLGDPGAEAALNLRIRKARRVGWGITGVSVPVTALGAAALNSYVNGSGGTGSLVLGATLLSFGATGLITGPIWATVRPWALRENPSVFYPVEQMQEEIEWYNAACGY